MARQVLGRHTDRVKRLLAIALCCGTAAHAEMIRAPQEPPVDPDRGNFWRELAEPHKDEVNVIVFKARQAIAQGEITLVADYDPTGEGRQKLYHQLFGMLAYARRLEPDNLDVLKLYAQSADAIGKTRQAMDALHAVIDLVGPDKAGVEVTGKLGEIYLRLGELDDAIRYLRESQGPLVPGNAITASNLVHLSSALAMRGQTTEAIDVLADALPVTPPYYANEYQVVTFALAVAYDRDDQRSLAVEQLDHLRTNLQEGWGQAVHAALAPLRFAPAEDQQYYQALLLEATDNYGDARAGWALYAASHGAYTERALDHIAAIDNRPKTAVSTLQPAATGTFRGVRRHRRHP
jgi:tetratricopeptide (TPR) repeat protein